MSTGITSLEFANKNQLRRFPFKADTTLRSVEGYVLPDTVVVDASISAMYGEHNVYVSQLWHNGVNFSITISSDTKCIGNFTGVLSADIQQLTLTRFTPYFDGWLMCNNTAALANTFPVGAYYFEPAATELEASRIFCYPLPGVLRIADSVGATVQGFTGFGTLANLFETISEPTNVIALEVDSTNALQSIADLATFFYNCPTPYITTINNTTPYPLATGPGDNTANDGNIYLVGVKPISFVGNITSSDAAAATPPAAGNDGSIDITTVGNTLPSDDLTLQSLCVQRNKLIAPEHPLYLKLGMEELYWSKSGLDATGAPQPPASLIGTTVAEYHLWPQFNTTS